MGGLISLIGALCYAELGTAYPHEGGDYVYLTRAFGRRLGFLFGWCQLWVVRPGSIGAMAFVFAEYADRLFPLSDATTATTTTTTATHPLMLYALAALAVLTVINILGVREGKWTQNLLTTVKVLGLIAVVGVGLAFGRAEGPLPGTAIAEPAPVTRDTFYLAMILILYAFGGWNEMAYVGAEVRNPEKNILRALVLGTVAVTAVYALVTYAFVHVLGLAGTRASHGVAAELLQRAVGPWGGKAISVLICISALGACNGMVFTGARIYSAMGNDHRLYSWLGRWSPRFGTPVWSLVIQSAITAALIALLGRKDDAFENLVNFTAPVFWVFFLLVGVSLFVLRRREPDAPRPYRVPGFPVTPVLFCLSSTFMVYASIRYAVYLAGETKGNLEILWSNGALSSIVLFAIGIVAMFLSVRSVRPAATDRLS